MLGSYILVSNAGPTWKSIKVYQRNEFPLVKRSFMRIRSRLRLVAIEYQRMHNPIRLEYNFAVEIPHFSASDKILST